MATDAGLDRTTLDRFPACVVPDGRPRSPLALKSRPIWRSLVSGCRQMSASLASPPILLPSWPYNLKLNCLKCCGARAVHRRHRWDIPHGERNADSNPRDFERILRGFNFSERTPVQFQRLIRGFPKQTSGTIASAVTNLQENDGILVVSTVQKSTHQPQTSFKRKSGNNPMAKSSLPLPANRVITVPPTFKLPTFSATMPKWSRTLGLP